MNWSTDSNQREGAGSQHTSFGTEATWRNRIKSEAPNWLIMIDSCFFLENRSKISGRKHELPSLVWQSTEWAKETPLRLPLHLDLMEINPVRHLKEQTFHLIWGAVFLNNDADKIQKECVCKVKWLYSFTITLAVMHAKYVHFKTLWVLQELWWTPLFCVLHIDE